MNKVMLLLITVEMGGRFSKAAYLRHFPQLREESEATFIPCETQGMSSRIWGSKDFQNIGNNNEVNKNMYDFFEGYFRV